MRLSWCCLATLLALHGIPGQAVQIATGSPNTKDEHGMPRITTTTSVDDAFTTRISTTVSEITCPSRTANYITHTLPQQCLRTDRKSPNSTANLVSTPVSSSGINGTTTTSTTHIVSYRGSFELNTITAPLIDASSSTPVPQIITDTPQTTTIVADTTSTESSTASTTEKSSDDDSDSPFDSASFLSFEQWKKQNLAKGGQSPDQIGRGTKRPEGNRQRPGINNALDTLGEEGEIDLDFVGFGGGANVQTTRDAVASAESEPAMHDQGVPKIYRSKDAGTTCKERTNYASFDCAATVLKTNPQCKSASSILVENKDSYMLNPCSADNKFFIVELCNEILIDTVVLASYEFFSSIFRQFRVSTSDRYPVKADKWNDIGTFEARNTREVQAFLIEYPIWARYLRVELLSHYGNEYYCPLSLLRVHGTTMLEQVRNEVERARGEPEDELASVESEAMTNPSMSEELPESEEIHSRWEPPSAEAKVQFPSGNNDEVNPIDEPPEEATKESDGTMTGSISNSIITPPSESGTAVASVAGDAAETQPASSSVSEASLESKSSKSYDSPQRANTSRNMTASEEAEVDSGIVSETLQQPLYTNVDTKAANNYTATTNSQSPAESLAKEQSSTSSEAERTSTPNTSESESLLKSSADAKSSSDSTSSTRNSSARSSTSTSSAPSSQPSTQDSFFQSIHKRLQQLESNSTLSLMYIEEQSRILRDAFSKVEKRQLNTATNFLSQLNDTVMVELHGFRQAYDQLWQSTVIELDAQRERSQREMLALSSRLTMVADELVWQKRLGIAQSTLLLLCLGLVLFARNGAGTLDAPLYRLVANKSQSALVKVEWESPPDSPTPEGRSPPRFSRRKSWRSSQETADATFMQPPETGPESDSFAVDAVSPSSPDTMTADDSDGEVEQEDLPDMIRTLSSPAVVFTQSGALSSDNETFTEMPAG